MDKSQQTQPTDEPTQPERRSLIGTSALAGATALVGGWIAVLCGEHPALGQSPAMAGASGAGAGHTGHMQARGWQTAAGLDADVEPLNALLAAEYNAIRAYTAGAMLIKDAAASDPLDPLRGVIGDIALDFQSQHKMHAKALSDAISGLNGKPVDEAQIAGAFKAPQGLVDNPSIMNVLKYAASAERDAAVSYNQVLAGMQSARLRLLASSIEGDESQHFIVLTALVLGLAAPGPKLSSSTAGDVVPEAFVTSIDNYPGLDRSPPDYFA